jgi:hypothetical protein
MHLSTLLTPLLLLLPTILALPTVSPDSRKLNKRDSGSYIVSGLGQRKKDIVNAGGNVFDIAIAMLETERITTDYTYGDGKTCELLLFLVGDER